MSKKHRKKEFALYLDETGSPKPNLKDPYPVFAMGGVLLERSQEPIIEMRLTEFKARWQIAETPLHGCEIRAQKKRFAWLGKLPQEKQALFLEDLSHTIHQCPVVVHACVVSRAGYLNRYLDKYDEKTWEMMKSAFSIVVERAAKYTALQKGTLMVYFEQIGKKEDNLIKEYFHRLRSEGHPFDPAIANRYSPLSPTDLSQLLRGISGKTKSNLITQLADLCIYPVAQSQIREDRREFLALKTANQLIDCHLEPWEVDTLGIKYYCFDNAQTQQNR